MQQQSLFDKSDHKSGNKKDLAIAKKGKQALTKQQINFNRLTKKIEKLRADIERTTFTLDANLAYYSNHIHQLEQKMVNFRITGVKVFYPYYTGEKKLLSGNEKKTLKEIITVALDEIYSLAPDTKDEELSAIFTTIMGMSLEDVKNEAFNEMKEDFEAELRDAGFDINLEGIEAGMNEEELLLKMKEKQAEFEKLADEMEAKNASRKKTKKQLAQEERGKQVEAARKKSISSIYKQLAKAFHPDLESDEEIKLQKEVIMKQLTVAYENNDLHTLLKLELEWIQKENNDPAKLTDDKLAIYNEALQEQVGELGMQMDMLETHPRYTPLRRFNDNPADLSMQDMYYEKRDLEAALSTLAKEEVKLKGNNAVKFIKEIIYSFKRQSKQSDEMEELMQELMRYMK